MKILIVSFLFPPQNAIGGLRPYYWARYFASQGYEVEVLTTKRDRVEENNKEFNFVLHEVEMPRIFNLLKKIYYIFFKDKNENLISSQKSHNKTNFIKKIYRYLVHRGLSTSTRMPDPSDLWILSSFKWISLQKARWDFVISTFGPYSSHIIAKKIKERNLARFWISDFRDLWCDSEFAKGFPIFRGFERYLERKIIENSDLTTTVSDPISKLFSEKYPGNKVVTILNGFDPTETNTLISEHYFNNKKINISYTGTIYPGKRDPTPLFFALIELKKEIPNLADFVLFHFFGPNVNLLSNQINNLNLNNCVKVYPTVPRADSLRIQRDSDVLLFLESSDPKVVGVLTGKLFEYIFTQNPVWGIGINNSTESGKILKQISNCRVLESNINLIKNEIKNLIQSKSIKKSLLNKELIAFTRDYQSEKLNLIIKKMASER